MLCELGSRPGACKGISRACTRPEDTGFKRLSKRLALLRDQHNGSRQADMQRELRAEVAPHEAM